MKPLILAIGLLLVASSAFAARRALVVASNDGGTSLPMLRYAHTDAHRVADVLKELGDFEVTTLTGATADDLREALALEAVHGSADDVFIVYWSGHADAAGLRLGDESYAWSLFEDDVRSVPARVRVGIVDACRSGVVTSKGASTTPTFMAQPRHVQGEAWLAAASFDENAQESHRLQGGTFTHHFVTALRGAGTGDDGLVTLGEAYAYASTRTVAETSAGSAGPQHPAYRYELHGNGDLVLTSIDDASARLIVPASDAARVAVVQGDRLIAEAWQEPGAALELAVPPGKYTVRRRSSTGLSEASVQVMAGRATELTAWAPARPSRVVMRGPAYSALLVEEENIAATDVALRDLEDRVAAQQATLSILETMEHLGDPVWFEITDELPDGWRIVEAVATLDTAEVWHVRSEEGVRLDKRQLLHAADLAPGPHVLRLTLTLKPTARLPYLAEQSVEIDRSLRFVALRGAHTTVGATADLRGPFVAWEHRPRLRFEQSHTKVRGGF